MSVYVMGPTTWSAGMNAVNAVSNIANTATAGVAVPRGFRGEYTHLAVLKNDTCTLKIWGHSNEIAQWVQVDTVVFAEKNPEAQLVRGVAGYDRVQASVNAIGSGTISTYWGFTGGE